MISLELITGAVDFNTVLNLVSNDDKLFPLQVMMFIVSEWTTNLLKDIKEEANYFIFRPKNVCIR